MTVALEGHLSLALELADLARHTLLNAYRPDYAHSIKSDGSPVTALDQEIERKLRSRIEERFPHHGILGEEYGVQDIDQEYVWVLDPIDGTSNAVAGIPIFSVSMALADATGIREGYVANLSTGQVYHAARGEGATLDGAPIRVRPAPTENRLYL